MKLAKGTKTILAIGDMHAPFAHADSLAFLKDVRSKFKTNETVCLGDEIDAYALSSYDHDPDGMSAGQEHAKALEQLKPLYTAFPEMKVCTSNHTNRPFRRAFSAGIPAAFLRSYSEFMQSPEGWIWEDRWEVDGVLFEHGEGYSGKAGALTAAQTNMQSTVIGHLHSFAGVAYFANNKETIFGFNVGCLIDPSTYAFAYGKFSRAKPNLGVGVILHGVPLFVPMHLDKHGRWTGRL